jgi:hypothetical protein
MDWILDELQKNNVEIDMKTLSYHINYLIERHNWEYGHMLSYVNRDNIPKVFTEISVINFGRAMAYLLIVYLLKESEEVTRDAVRLVATPMKNIDFTAFKIEESFFHRLKSYIEHVFKNEPVE